MKLCSFVARAFSSGRLISKSLIRLSGATATDFLQGLVTNDLTLFDRSNRILHSLMLNLKGRSLSDLFLYKLDSEIPSYLLEVHTSRLEPVLTHLTKYNLRKKVKIYSDQQSSVWIVLPPSSATLPDIHSWISTNFNSSTEANAHYFVDPRGVPGWSIRMILPNTISEKLFTAMNVATFRLEDYHLRRWRLGLPECPFEIIPDETLPLEANADLSGSVNFSKGCYIGQELTARTRFTGVVRRRFVPVRLELVDSAQCNLVADGCHFVNQPVYSGDSTLRSEPSPNLSLGRLRGFRRWTENGETFFEGLALLRLSEVSGIQSQLFVSVRSSSDDDRMVDLKVMPYAPRWWPNPVAPGLMRL